MRPVTGVRGSPREGRSTDGGSRAKAGAPPVPHPAGPHPLGAGGAADASRVPGAAVAALLRGPRPLPRTPLRRRGCPDQLLPARAAPARLRAEGAAFRTAGVSCPRSGVARGGRTGARGAPWGPAPRGTAPADRGPAGRRRAGGSVSPSLRPPVPAAAAARPPHGETRPRPRPRSARPRRPPTLARCRPGSRLVPRGQGRRAGRGRRAVSGAGDAFPGVPLGATGRDRAAGEGEGGRRKGVGALRRPRWPRPCPGRGYIRGGGGGGGQARGPRWPRGAFTLRRQRAPRGLRPGPQREGPPRCFGFPST